jgi:hypothetical protein
MKLIGKTEIRLENYEKCAFICENDSPLGELYDFSCALKSFIFEKIKAAEEAEKKEETSQTK